MVQLGRTLTREEHARALSASRGSLEQQRAFARAFDRKTFDAWQGWVWGRQSFDLKVGAIDVPPAKVRSVSTLTAIEYLARKLDDDKIARRAVYRHKHDDPPARIVSTSEFNGAGRELSSRGVAHFAGPALFVLGELCALEGHNDRGDLVRWSVPSKGWILAGCPRTDNMIVIRQGPARAFPPVWIVRGKSPYILTDRGIDR
jgi:hypothetical protein